MIVPNVNTTVTTLPGFATFIEAYSISDIPKFATQDMSQHKQCENVLPTVANKDSKPDTSVQSVSPHHGGVYMKTDSQISSSVLTSRGIQVSNLIERWLYKKLLVLQRTFFVALKRKANQNSSKSQKDNLYQQQLLKAKKSKNMSRQRKNNVLRKITEKDEQHEEIQAIFQFDGVDKKIQEVFSILTLKKKISSATQVRVIRDLNKIFAFNIKSTKFKIEEQPFYHSLDSKIVENIPQKLKALPNAETIIVQRGDLQENQDQLLKMSFLKERRKTETNKVYQVQSSWKNKQDNTDLSLKSNWTHLEIQNNQNKNTDLTYFGSEAIDFKNSLIKQRQFCKQKSQKLANIQQIQRKSMPVKPSFVGAEFKKDENDEGRRKVVKLRSKIKENCSRYQQSQEFILCSAMNCFNSEIQIKKSEESRNAANQRSSNKKYKCLEGSLGINSQICISSQIKDSVASTTFKTSLYDLDGSDEIIDIKNDYFPRQKSLSCANNNQSFENNRTQPKIDFEQNGRKTMLINNNSINRSFVNISQLANESNYKSKLLKKQSHHSHCSSPQSISRKQETICSDSKTTAWRNSLICTRNPGARANYEQNYIYNFSQMEKMEEKIRKDNPIYQKLKYKSYDINPSKKGGSKMQTPHYMNSYK